MASPASITILPAVRLDPNPHSSAQSFPLGHPSPGEPTALQYKLQLLSTLSTIQQHRETHSLAQRKLLQESRHFVLGWHQNGPTTDTPTMQALLKKETVASDLAPIDNALKSLQESDAKLKEERGKVDSMIEEVYASIKGQAPTIISGLTTPMTMQEIKR